MIIFMQCYIYNLTKQKIWMTTKHIKFIQFIDGVFFFCSPETDNFILKTNTNCIYDVFNF